MKNSAYSIIEAKGATYYAVAQAVKRICTAILRDERTIMPVSTYLDGEYGVSNLCMSMPSIVGKDGIKKVIEIKLNESEHNYLMESKEKLTSIINELEDEGLI